MNVALLPLLFALGLSPTAEAGGEGEGEPSVALTIGYYGPYVIHPTPRAGPGRAWAPLAPSPSLAPSYSAPRPNSQLEVLKRSLMA